MATLNSVAVTFEHILVPTDFSDASQRALDYAKAIAKQENAELLLIHVAPPLNLIAPPEAAWIDESEIQSLQEQQLEQSGAALRSDGYRAQTISATGSLRSEILTAVAQYIIDLIVLGTHGRKGLERLLMGSDAEGILRRARCPVLSVGPAVPPLRAATWRLREIVCATTFDPNTAEMVAFAHKFAALHEAELVLFHIKATSEEKSVDWASFEAAFHQYVPVELGTHSLLRARLASTAPGTNIVEFARQRGSDLIVMGARPTSMLATHLPRGTAAKVLAEAPCPVMTLLEQ